MSTDDSPLNPYAPTSEVAAADVKPPIEVEPPGTLTRAAIRWFTVCGISALPSFFFGFTITGGRISGMLLGIFIFAVGYTLLDFRTAEWPIRQKKPVRRTLKITYGTRIAISLIFPIGGYLDLICGIFSIGIVGSLVGQSLANGDAMSFFTSLATTLVQGCMLNLVLGVYALIIHGVQAVVIAMKN